MSNCILGQARLTGRGGDGIIIGCTGSGGGGSVIQSTVSSIKPDGRFKLF